MSFIPIACCPSSLGTVTIEGPVETIESGGFTPVAESRWSDTDFTTLTLGGSVVLTSPVPAVDERVVVDWLSFGAQITVNVAAVISQVQIRQVSGSSPVYWNMPLGFIAAAAVGTIMTFEQTGLYIFGDPGEQLELVIPAVAGITITIGANFGGFLATA